MHVGGKSHPSTSFYRFAVSTGAHFLIFYFSFVLQELLDKKVKPTKQKTLCQAGSCLVNELWYKGNGI